MNTLLPYEYEWIAKLLKIYKIKYAEIYNEVYDHILSACEDKRRNGDIPAIVLQYWAHIDNHATLVSPFICLPNPSIPGFARSASHNR